MIKIKIEARMTAYKNVKKKVKSLVAQKKREVKETFDMKMTEDRIRNWNWFWNEVRNVRIKIGMVVRI